MFRALASAGVIGLLGGAAAGVHQLPSLAAGGLLHPARQSAVPAAPVPCIEKNFPVAEGITLRGWVCAAAGRRRGTVIYLHGIADNRGSSIGAIHRFTAAGFDVVAYDSRAHGASDGEVCTYGYFEKADLQRVIDSLAPGPVILVGTSLGAAVALQAAAEDPRISGVVAAEVFSDLETVARERAPFFLWDQVIRDAFAVAEQRAGFRIGDVSPETAARSIRVPAMLLHGADDRDTPPAHSLRVYAALSGPKRLIVVPHAAHNQSLHRAETWTEIDRFIQDVIMRGAS